MYYYIWNISSSKVSNRIEEHITGQRKKGDLVMKNMAELCIVLGIQ